MNMQEPEWLESIGPGSCCGTRSRSEIRHKKENDLREGDRVNEREGARDREREREL